MKRLLHFDCFSGLSGDMILGSLLDLGLPLAAIERPVRALGLSGFALRVEKEKRSGIAATRFFVDVDPGEQPHRHFSDIRRMIEGADLSARVKERAVSIFRLLAEAEARVHGEPIEHVHFHEVGAVDSIVDIVGAAAAFEHFDAEISCAPVPLGHGMIRTAHGVLPVPAPATLCILQGVPVEGTEIGAELTTPTGAAVVKASASRFTRFPAMVPLGVGFGAGARTHETRPGLLRAVLGEPADAADTGRYPACYVLEANVDNVTGEIAAEAARALLAEGALDAWFEPIQMKKGRPALKFGLLARPDDLERLAARLLTETPTIGLRYYPVGRIETARTMHTVETPYGPIPVKVARGPGKSANAAPEFEECRKAAERHGVPVKQVIAVAAGLAQKLLE